MNVQPTEISSSRAREILDTMRVQRLSVAERFKGASSPSATPLAASEAEVKDRVACETGAATTNAPATASAISKQLHESLAERRSRLNKRFQFNEDGSDGKNSFRSTQSTVASDEASASLSPIAGSAAEDAIINRSIHVKVAPPTTSAETPVRNFSNCSAASVTPELSVKSGSIQLTATANKKPPLSPHKPPTLQDIREAFELELSVPNLAASSSSSLRQPSPDAPTAQQPVDAATATAEAEATQPPNKAKTLNLVSPVKFSKPVVQRSPKLLTLHDVEIAPELSPIDTRPAPTAAATTTTAGQAAANTGSIQTEVTPRSIQAAITKPLPSWTRRAVVDAKKGPLDSSSHHCPPSPTSSLSSVSLCTKEERKAYIGALYNPGEKRKMLTPKLTPTTGLRRHERSQLNRVMVRGRVGVLQGTNCRVFVPTTSGTPAAKTAAACEQQHTNDTPRRRRGAPKVTRPPRLSNDDHSGRGAATRRSRAATRQSSVSGAGEKKFDVSVVAVDESEKVVVQQPQALNGVAAQSTVDNNESESPPGSVPIANTTQSKDPSQRDSSHKVIEQKFLDISVVNDHEKRIALLSRLQEGMNKHAEKIQAASSQKYVQRPASPTSSTSSTLSDEIVLSDDSSFDDFTTSSDTTGWTSSVGNSTTIHFGDDSIAGTDLHSVVSGVTMPPFSPVDFGERPRVKDAMTNRIVSFAGELSIIEVSETEDNSETPREEIKTTSASTTPSSKLPPVPRGYKPKMLFVTGRAADALCKANGGHFALAVASGFSRKKKPVRLNVAPAVPTVVRLSTDFRCGTRGSLYDVAVRSGCKVREPNLPSSRRRASSRSDQSSSSISKNSRSKKVAKRVDGERVFMSARGGLYDTALHSGLTKEALRSRTPFSVTTKQRSLTNENSTDNGSIVPEETSDRKCGANGSLAMLKGYPPVGVPHCLSKKSLFAIEEVEGPESVW